MNTRSCNKWTAAVLTLATGIGCLLPAVPTSASRRSERTWRYLTYGAGALTGYGIARGKGGLALLGAAGTAYSYSRWRRDIRNRHRWERGRRSTRYTRYHRRRHYR